MASSWKESQQSDPHQQNREHQSAIIIIHNLLNANATTPEQAARDITSNYEPCLLAGKTDLCSLWYLICLVVLDPATTDQNLEELVEMLVHISRSPAFVVDGKIVKENGREYWHDLPELSFWFMEYALSLYTIESIDEGRTRITWSEHPRHFQVANRFGAILLNRIDPNIAPKVLRGFRQLALETIRDALEVSIESPAQIRRAGIHVPVAAQWFLYASPQIWAFSKDKEGYEGEKIWKEWLGGSDGSKPTRVGDDKFSVERWLFWKEQYVEVLEVEERGGRVIDKIVSHARRAIKAMDDAEQGNTIRS
ncbi:hypothetical protein KCU83_g3959, partial [Aureobasidium melanogenum]